MLHNLIWLGTGLVLGAGLLYAFRNKAYAAKEEVQQAAESELAKLKKKL